MQNSAELSLGSVYGDEEAPSALKMVILAPETQHPPRDLVQRGTIVSIGHITTDYDTGTSALGSGAKRTTHIFNAMNPFDLLASQA